MEIGFHQLKLARSSVQKTSLFQTKKRTLSRGKGEAEGSSHPISASLQGLQSQPFGDHPDSLEPRAHEDSLEKVYSFSVSSSHSLSEAPLAQQLFCPRQGETVSPSRCPGRAQDLEVGHPNDKGKAQGQGRGAGQLAVAGHLQWPGPAKPRALLLPSQTEGQKGLALSSQGCRLEGTKS